MTPTGKIIGENKTLATVSDIKSIREPKRADDGIKNLWSVPIILLEICGAIKPTKLIIPKNETHTEIRIDAKNIPPSLVLCVFTPRTLALSSPLISAL